MLQRLFLAAPLFAWLAAPAAQASWIAIDGNGAQSTSQLGNFSGKLTYDALSATSATLTVQLTNTSNPANGGFITGFVFNNPGNALTGASLTASNANFVLLGGPNFQNSINGAPFGSFDMGAALGGNYLGGGSPLGGLAVGQNGTFNFSLTGTHLNSLQVGDFVSARSDVQKGGGGGAQFLAVRFRGFANGGSDKVPGVPVSGGPVGAPLPTPEPTTLLLAGMGAGLACVPPLLRRRRRAEHA